MANEIPFRSWVDKVNGYGVMLRFILPIFVAVLGGSLNMNINSLKTKIADIKKKQTEVKAELIRYQSETRSYNTNHLETHRKNEIEMAGRLSRIETLLQER